MELLYVEIIDMMKVIFLFMIISLIPMILMSLIIFLSKKIKTENIIRELLAKIYIIVSRLHNYLVALVLLVFFFRISKLISIILIFLTVNIHYTINGLVLTNLQIQFMLLTMMIVFYYPISILFIKYFTLKISKEEGNEKNMVVAMFNGGIEFVQKIPIEEIINIGYVVFLIYSSIVKLEIKDNSFDNNYIYLSFIIYLAIQTTAIMIYKKHKCFFDKLDNRFFKTNMFKKESKKLNVSKDLKLANEYAVEFIRTGKRLKDQKIFLNNQ